MAGRFFEIQNGLVEERTWDEADTSALGAGYTERSGDWDINANKLRISSNSANREPVLTFDLVDRGEMFVQAIDVDMSSTFFSTVGILARWVGTGQLTNAGSSGYSLRYSDAATEIAIIELSSGAVATIATANLDGDELDIDFQFYVADGVQEGWVSDDGTPVTVSATDVAHDGQNARDAGFWADTTSGVTGFHTFDEWAVCLSKFITITGLQAGWKGKLLNGSDVVIAQATESGGTATIDCSRFGGCTELMPVGGFAHLITTDASDQEQGRISVTVYPGGNYGYTNSVPVYGSLPAVRFEVWTDVAANSGTMKGVLTGSGVQAAKESRAITGEETLDLTVVRNSAGWAHVTQRSVIRVVFLGTFDEWRITKITESESRDGKLVGLIHCESIRYDLILGGLLEKVDVSPSGVFGVGGLSSLHFEVYQQLPSTHLDLILGNLAPFVSPGPSYFTKGAVGPIDPVDMIYDWDTRLSSLDELAVVTASELDVVRVGTSTYNVDLVTLRGAGSDVPIYRVGKNVLTVEHRDSSEQQATRVYPQGGGGAGERTTIAENAFEILALPGGGVVQFVLDPVLESGQLEGMGLWALKPDGTLTSVTSSTAPDTVTLADVSGLVVGQLITFKRNSAGDDLVYLESVASSAVSGVLPEVVQRSDIPSVNNLLSNAFFTSWSGGNPVGWTVQGGTVTVVENTNPLYTEFGASSALLQGQVDDCLIGGPMILTATPARPHFSAQLNVWVVSGSISLEIWDITDPTNIIRYPLDTGNRRSVTSVANNWSSLFLPLPHDFVDQDPQTQAFLSKTFSFYVCCSEPQTKAYIDAGMFIQSANAGGEQVFHDGRGSNALWIAGNDHLFLFKDSLSEYQASVLDLGSLDPTNYPEEKPTLGGNATIWVPHLGNLKTTQRIKRIDRNLQKETDVQLQFSTEIDELTRQLEATQRRRKKLKKPVDESEMPPKCGMTPRSWLVGDLVVEWDRTPGAARFELRDTTASGNGTPKQRYDAGVRLANTDDTVWILKDPGTAVLPPTTSLPHPSNVAEIIMEAFNHWGVPGGCYEVVKPVNLGPPTPCPNVIVDSSVAQTFCSGTATPGGAGIVLRNPPLVINPNVIAAIVPGQTAVTLCHAGSTSGVTAIVGYIAPVWSAIGGFMRYILSKVGGASGFPHSFNVYGGAPALKWSSVGVQDNGSGGSEVGIAFGDPIPQAIGPDWSQAAGCCWEDVSAGAEFAGSSFQPGVRGGGGGTAGPWVHYQNAYKNHVVTVTGLSSEKIRLTRTTGDAYIGPHTAATLTKTGTGTWDERGQTDPVGNNFGGGWWDTLEVLDSSDVVQAVIHGFEVPSGKIWLGSTFDFGTGFTLTSHIAVNSAGTIGMITDGFLFEENWGVTATAIDSSKYSQSPAGIATYDPTKQAVRMFALGNLLRSDVGVHTEIVSNAVVEVESLDLTGVGATTLAATADVQSKLRATFDNGTIFTSPGANTGDLSIFATDIAFQNLVWPIGANSLTVEQIQTGTAAGLACSKDVRLNVGAVCCPFGGLTVLPPGLPPVAIDCLLSATSKTVLVDTCAGSAGVQLAVSGWIKKTSSCPNLDIQNAFRFDAMYFEEWDPVGFPDQFVLVRRDLNVSPIPTITASPQGDPFGWSAVFTNEDPLGINPTPGTARASDGAGGGSVAKKWFVRVILFDVFGTGSAHIDTIPTSTVIPYGWC